MFSIKVDLTYLPIKLGDFFWRPILKPEILPNLGAIRLRRILIPFLLKPSFVVCEAIWDGHLQTMKDAAFCWLLMWPVDQSGAFFQRQSLFWLLPVHIRFSSWSCLCNSQQRSMLSSKLENNITLYLFTKKKVNLPVVFFALLS